MKYAIYMFLILLLVIFSSVNILADENPETEPYSEVLLVNNDSGVQYQSKILEEFNKSSEVRIMVTVKDTTGIIVTKEHTKEQQNILDKLKKEFLVNKTDIILSTLTETEFKLKRKFLLGGFSGNVTQEGFNKLINNPNIAKIHHNGVADSGVIDIVKINNDIKKNNTADVVDINSELVVNTENDFITENLIEKNEIVEEQEPEIIKEDKPKSWFSKFIHFLISLFS